MRGQCDDPSTAREGQKTNCADDHQRRTFALTGASRSHCRKNLMTHRELIGII